MLFRILGSLFIIGILIALLSLGSCGQNHETGDNVVVEEVQ